MPPRIQRFRLRLMRYIYQGQYEPAKHQTVADFRSCTPVGTPDRADECFEVKAFTTQAKTSLPATAARLKEIQEVDEIQKVDEECSQVRVYYLHGWPAYMPHQPLPGPY